MTFSSCMRRLVEVGKVKLSTSENDLLRKKEYVIEQVLSIHFRVNHICVKYRIELDDLMQVGRIALWEASQRFKVKEDGLSFDSYARRIIRFRLLGYLDYLKKPIRHLHYCSSIYSEVGDRELLEVIPSDVDVYGQVMELFYFKEMVSNLTNQEKKFLKLRLEGYSYAETEKKMRVKKKRFIDVRFKVMNKLRSNFALQQQ